MWLLAWRQLQWDAWRTVLTACALGTVIAVILVLEGFEQGQYRQLQQAVLHRGGDLIVTEAGVANFIAGRSALPQTTRAQIEAIAGVKQAYPLTTLPLIFTRGEQRTPIAVLVHEQLGGPDRLLAGRVASGSHDIVIDLSLAKKYRLNLGDPLTLAGYDFVVVGIAQGAAAFFMPFTFISYDALIDFMLESEAAPDLSTFPLLNFLLVELNTGADPVATAATIRARLPEVAVYPPRTLAQNDVAMGEVLLKPIMGLLVGVADLIGLIVVALILHADVQMRRRSLAVLKALGFSQVRLAWSVVWQALLLLALALPLGLLLATGFAAFINQALPLYQVHVFEPARLAQTMLGSLAFALGGALLALLPLRRADPLSAFQGP